MAAQNVQGGASKARLMAFFNPLQSY